VRRILLGIAAAVLAMGPTAAGAATLQPSQWPPEARIGSAPNAIRFSGADRYATSLSMALALRGSGGFPFDTPDRTSGGATSLAAANGWWGAKTCPRSVIVVAGDTPADALAAAPLSDPTNKSNEPRLERVAAADPLFDPIGGFDRVDTASAPIIVTASARSGAAALSPSARVAATDLAAGGCTTAREAIIVGGDAAVPVEVESELVSLGYEEVFRVAGTTRFDTAARIATALGTEAPVTGATCLDRRTDDGRTQMGFYGNGVIEYRSDSAHCDLHGRTVALADGSVGADALAAGWWTSFWQVPVLLVDGHGRLPAATRTALQTMAIDTIVVLGGTARITEATVDEAKQLAGAVVGRFAGVDRYETSVVMAEVFGGWHGTGDGDDFEGDIACLAASDGGAGGRGWPDALAAGPWCARANGATGAVTVPTRTVPPAEETAGTMEGGPRAHDAAPVLLVRPGEATLQASVAELLGSAFVPAPEWCRPQAVTDCRVPGFVVSFGGTATVADVSLRQASAIVGGAQGASPPDPTAAEAFRTALDLAPIFDDVGSDGAERACFERADLTGARWLAVYGNDDLTSFVSASDITAAGIYEPGVGNRPTCLRMASEADGDAAVVAVSTWGATTAGQVVRYAPDRTMAMSGPMRHEGPLSSDGPPATTDVAEDASTWTFSDPPADLAVRDRDVTFTVDRAIAGIYLDRRAEGGRATFIADVDLAGAEQPFVGTATGEAELVGDRWELAGLFRLSSASGGFRASLLTQGTDDTSDDVLSWRIDASYP
jgi:putative cell wall-binding protein